MSGAVHAEGHDVPALVTCEDRVPDERDPGDDRRTGVHQVRLRGTLLIDPQGNGGIGGGEGTNALHVLAPDEGVHVAERVVADQRHDADRLLHVGGDEEGEDGGGVGGGAGHA